MVHGRVEPGGSSGGVGDVEALIRLRPGTVLEVTESDGNKTTALVEVDGKREPAIAYDALCGGLQVGQRVVLNTTAVALGLGSGGYHFVIAAEGNSRLDSGPEARVMKLRYTPLQVAVKVPEEETANRGKGAARPAGPGRCGLPNGNGLADFRSLEGMPVVIGELHSMVAPALAGAKAAVPGGLRTAYIMTDGGALPAWFSRTVSRVREAGLADIVITAGHAFGGDSEAVNVYSALAQARALARADVAVVAMGPGIVGTGTRLGFTGLECADVANATQALGGRPFLVPRLSFHDPRDRHRGLSHHTRTVLELTLARTVVAVHQDAPKPVLEELARLTGRRHALELGDGGPGLSLLGSLGIPLATMGRGLAEERHFFLAASAAGWAAAGSARSGPRDAWGEGPGGGQRTSQPSQTP